MVTTLERAAEWLQKRNHRVYVRKKNSPHIVTESGYYQPKRIYASTIFFGEDEWERLKEHNATILAFHADEEEPLVIPLQEIQNTRIYKNIRITFKKKISRRYTLSEEEYFFLRECMKLLKVSNLREMYERLSQLPLKYPPLR